jgi:hypothetical protein
MHLLFLSWSAAGCYNRLWILYWVRHIVAQIVDDLGYTFIVIIQYVPVIIRMDNRYYPPRLHLTLTSPPFTICPLSSILWLKINHYSL